MFLNQLKLFVAKQIVNKSLSNVKLQHFQSKIKTVGLLVDETQMQSAQFLLQKLLDQGITLENISVLIFKDVISKTESIHFPSISYQDMNWLGRISKHEVISFEACTFDILIDFYDVEKIPLLAITQNSKAHFKVGFASIDQRLHHFFIATSHEKKEVFINELLKYLKILKKI